MMSFRSGSMILSENIIHYKNSVHAYRQRLKLKLTILKLCFRSKKPIQLKT